MIIIRITRADLVLPRYLYHVLDNIKWEEVEAYSTKISYAKNIKMRREQGEKQMKLGELCKVIDTTKEMFNENDTQITLMRGDITINDINQVNIIE